MSEWYLGANLEISFIHSCIYACLYDIDDNTSNTVFTLELYIIIFIDFPFAFTLLYSDILLWTRCLHVILFYPVLVGFARIGLFVFWRLTCAACLLESTDIKSVMLKISPSYHKNIVPYCPHTIPALGYIWSVGNAVEISNAVVERFVLGMAWIGVM